MGWYSPPISLPPHDEALPPHDGASLTVSASQLASESAGSAVTAKAAAPFPLSGCEPLALIDLAFALALALGSGGTEILRCNAVQGYRALHRPCFARAFAFAAFICCASKRRKAEP